MTAPTHFNSTACHQSHQPEHAGNVATGAASAINAETCNLMQANHSDVPCTPSASVGESTERPARASELEQRLLDAGVTAQVLMALWGVTLWGLKPKHERIKIKVEATKPIDMVALEHWFEAILGQPVSIKQSPVSACCESPCKGCFWADPDKRAFWSAAQCPPNASAQS